ncbi:Na+/H+ antiporter NhaC family protein [Larsenimonas suaedae]|uniref:Na+/H+ antiporter NhaC family protein n=1 Tax=Larsenimonas suaedae TaxID=1851019 RepID=A0ABU1GXW7_9GAMM|nr:Na+/H+ antiporter NhaC family protein [Larsenimonas suaedae]MCM2973280.1 Na+/H+ antiporter NhaC family protein [Larsenimonas suaedae]MDR5896173.1 Na+/H+ antiporter NhaC family protein [Larsenimonas suaedae]
MSSSPVTEAAQGETRSPTLTFRLGVWGAAIPLLFFVVWAITISVLGFATEIGLIMGALFGLTLGLFFCKSRWHAYAEGLFSGLTQPIGVVALIAWFYAGMFAQVLQTGGLVEGLIWLGSISNTTGGLFVGLAFLLAAVFSSAVGTGYGTVVAFCTFLYPAGIAVGGDPVMLFAAILSGAIFGDNLAPVSDTTIVSATTQDADVPGVVRSRFKYSIMAGIPTLILLVLFGGSDAELSGPEALAAMQANTDPQGLIMLAPFALVLVLALRGQHLLTSLTWGILTGCALMIATGLAAPSELLGVDANGDMTGALVRGVKGYLNMAVLILLIVGAAHLMTLGGTMERITELLMRWIKNSVRRAELAIWGLVAALNSAITINTAAEIAAAPFVRELGTRYRIHRYRRANMLDAVTSALGYIFPWGAPVLLGWATISSMQATYDWLPIVSPTSVFPFVFQGWLLLAIMLFAAITGWGRTFEDKDGNVMTKRPTD